MRISRSWLAEWLPELELDAQALGDRLTMAGLELDALETAAPPCTGVVVGRVLSVEQHPDADRLRVCRVDDGSDRPQQVVCGAPNVFAGMLAPYARLGAVLPGGLKIKKAKLRGMESYGMLCSEAELGLAESSDGLMQLPEEAPIGQDIREYLGLDDAVLELDLTPNRADCLSMLGVARESALLTGSKLVSREIDAVQPQCDEIFPVVVDAVDACPRYAGRVVRGVRAGARAPLWMRERLRRAGVRSISAPVDVTNYVMLELGQPMHAFDLAKLSEGIRVRVAEDGERLVLIDGQEVTVSGGTLLITDASGPLAIAGIMGGAASAVSDATTDLFLESAYFDPQTISGRARTLGLHTDSSHRYERGVDPSLQLTALERATELLTQIAGGHPGPITEVCANARMPRREAVLLRRERIAHLLGLAFEDAQVSTILSGLGCAVEAVEIGWRVVPPAHRFDLSIEADLIEELARVRGYETIPERRVAVRSAIERRSEAQLATSRLRETLRVLEYQEAITYSFISADSARLFAPQAVPIELANPLSAELAVMRPSLWPGLIAALNHNRKRQSPRGRLFETGLSFLHAADELLQQRMLAGAAYGNAYPEQWGLQGRALDFFDIKGDVEAVLKRAGVQADFVAHEHPALHPGQSARVIVDDKPVGWIGMLHPELEGRLGLGCAVGLFELELAAITRGRVPVFEPVSRFPALRRDLALIVADDVQAGEVMRAMRALEIPEMQDVHLFDVYVGKGVDEGYKSLAFGLIFQGFSSSLTDREVEAILSRIMDELDRRFGARPRG
ncbi:phenylalanine--tRNA ligase subunit beta [Acidihalobacter ferrooxydans]|uniref:Phenylalanine--tRNA ligase beta subunit n=1 Tax=Acidihalobacter ferrooxydans TaxID=1765967 RepID=A0A1P8UEJ4_9GAMM|nr:phenylalanine--tRNA ligase subunit beta [Acidihalobacter ferrooxydans]APZ42277.1 phenylalanine--tRNA ligase subunit beta [Acidihalobacter ferrooxydans]